MTEFQEKILAYIQGRKYHIVGTWDIAVRCFPEKWKNKASRGALITNIDRAATKIPGMVRLNPRDRWGEAKFSYHVSPPTVTPEDRK